MNQSDLKPARLAAGLTRSQVAQYAKVEPITVYRWETGRRTPQRFVLEAVLEWLKQQETP
ncbi:MAG: helix-turn-helix domain-containing protein [Verrucomicrobia bacterium]|jgi:transcriptional regulator with XRE-family HTH domain|nr:helix-turn-helix domain-containing protein [Verrucomicrobiota bacterium]